MENPPTSECSAADRSDHVRGSVRIGLGLDGEWKHQRLREDISGRRPVLARRLSIQSFAVLTSLTIAQPSSWEVSLRG